MDKFKQLMGSRKFWAAIIGLVFMVIGEFVPDFPLTADQVLPIVLVIVSYILGTALEDGLSRR